MKLSIKLSFFLIFSFIFNSQIKGQINGKLIGDDIWMTSNLNVAKFQNGDPIFEAKTNEQWIKANQEKKPAWCYYQNNAQNGVIYGKLYNWYAINDPRGLAPKGWHISTRSDWEDMISFLQKDKRDVNETLKSQSGWKQYEYGGTTEGSDCYECSGTGKLWSSISYKYKLCVFCGGTGGNKRYIKKRILSGNGTNTSGFSAKPGANRYDNGDFSKSTSGGFAIWWLASENKLEATEDKCILIDNNNYTPRIDNYGKGYGTSIRLVKDNPVKREKERVIQEEKLEKERLVKEAQIEKERLDKEAQIKKEKLAQEAQIERERVAWEAFVQKKKIENEEKAVKEKALKEKKVKDSVSIIGQSIVIGNLIVAQYDFPEMMTWSEAKKACASLGNGWRLPTKDELQILYENSKIIKKKNSGFSDKPYISSTEGSNNLLAWTQRLSDGYQNDSSKERYIYNVRAVRIL
jgi:uncharacterized protein (TIGR02145 family)